MILLTGASGFIGKKLLQDLIEVYGTENIIALTSKPLLQCRYLLHSNYNFDRNFFIREGCNEITTIIHAGAFTPKSAMQANDWQHCNSNIFNTAALLSAKFPNIERIVYLSTLDVYGSDAIISESSPIAPVSLYGNSKLYCEHMISSWANENQKKAQILRIGHVYGPGEEAYQKIIPVTIKRIIQQQSLQVWGTGEDRRAFIYINDVAKAILNAITLRDTVGPINVVSGQSISIKDLVHKMVVLSQYEAVIEYLPGKSPRRDLIFNNAKLQEYLLQNETSLEDGLREEWNYMKQIFS